MLDTEHSTLAEQNREIIRLLKEIAQQGRPVQFADMPPADRRVAYDLKLQQTSLADVLDEWYASSEFQKRESERRGAGVKRAQHLVEQS